MQRPHLLSGALLAALLGAGGCSREEAREEAREAASQARVAAARASDQLADSWLTTKIQAQYFADDDIKARNINVSTRDGLVVLTGNVDDVRAREQAVQIARNTDGVRQVEDRLSVDGATSATADAGTADRDASLPVTGPDPGATSGAVATSGGAAAMPPIVAVDDQAVTTRIQAKYFLDAAIKGRQIAVMTENGVVTLSGEVASDAERAQALVLARTTEGVQRVEDSLSVNASLTPGQAAPGDPSLSTPPANPAAAIAEPHDAPPEQ